MKTTLCDAHYGHGFCFEVECCGEHEHLTFATPGATSWTCPKCGATVYVTVKAETKITYPEPTFVTVTKTEEG